MKKNKANKIKKNTTWLQIVMAGVLISATVFGIVYLSTNFEKIKKGAVDGVTYYTQEQIEAVEKKAYEDALKEKSSYEKTISDLRESIVALQTTLQIKIEALSEKANGYDEAVAEIVELRKLIGELRAILENVVIENKIKVFYEVNGAVVKSFLLEAGEEFNINDYVPEMSNIKFIAWSLDGINPITTEIITPEDGTTFKALVEMKYTVKFIIEGEVLSNQLLFATDKITAPTTPIIKDKKFVGWSIDGQIVDLKDIVIDRNLNIEAVYLNKETVELTEVTVSGEVNSHEGFFSPSATGAYTVGDFYVYGAENFSLNLHISSQIEGDPGSGGSAWYSPINKIITIEDFTETSEISFVYENNNTRSRRGEKSTPLHVKMTIQFKDGRLKVIAEVVKFHNGGSIESSDGGFIRFSVSGNYFHYV